MAFANVYYFAGPGTDDGDSICTEPLDASQYEDGGWTCTRYDSFVSSLEMLLNGEWFFFGDFPRSKNSVVSMLYAFIIGVILLNIIIAVIIGAFERIKDNSEKAFWSNRYFFLVGGDVDSITRLFSFCCGYSVSTQGSLGLGVIKQIVFF